MSFLGEKKTRSKIISKSWLNGSSKSSCSDNKSSHFQSCKSVGSLLHHSKDNLGSTPSAVESSEHAEDTFSVVMDCPCGFAGDNGSDRLMCDGCSFYFHANCVGLSKEEVEWIAEEQPDWFCPRCCPAAEPNVSTSFLAASPGSEDGPAAEKASRKTSEKASPGSLNSLSLSSTVNTVPSTAIVENEADQSLMPPPAPLSQPPAEAESFLSKGADLSLMFEEAAEKMDLRVKPGKHWRRSLSISRGSLADRRSVIGQLSRGAEFLQPKPTPEFRAPDIPVRTAKEFTAPRDLLYFV